VDIRPVNRHVTTGAPLVVGVDHAMGRMVGIGDAARRSDAEVAVASVAFQAELRHGGPGQQLGILRSVRLVAGNAAIFLSGLVLEQERAALLDVAFHAGLVVSVRLVEHPGRLPHSESGGETAVGVVAIRAAHEALIDAVLAGEIELRLDIGVTAVAGVGLTLGEQVLHRHRMVIGMALGAGYIVLGVLGPANVSPIEILGVASEAAVYDFLRLHDRESEADGGPPAAGLDVRLGRAVASFAGGELGRLLAGCQAFEVRILVEAAPDVLVAGFTLGVSGVIRARGLDDRLGLAGGVVFRGRAGKRGDRDQYS